MNGLVRTVAGRLAALLLLGATGVRGSAPLVDAVQHHRGAAQQPAGIHLDQPGGCGSHAERCSLRSPDAGIHFVAGRTSSRVRLDTLLLHPVRPGDLAARDPAASPYHSRAPPHQSV